jgi:hypothetical protein
MDVSCNPGIISVTRNTVAGEKKEYMHTDAERVYSIYSIHGLCCTMKENIINAYIKPRSVLRNNFKRRKMDFASFL